MENRLKQIRKSLKLQQGEFAEKLGIVQQQLSKYERGENKPSYDFFIKLGEKFNVNLNWLFYNEGAMFVSPVDKNAEIIKVKIKRGQLLQVEYED